MAWNVRASGTASNGNNATSLSPGLPAGWQPGDLHILHVQTFGGTNSRVPQLPSGWTEFTGDAVWQNGTSSHLFAWRLAASGDTAPTVTMSGTGVANDTQVSRIHGFYTDTNLWALDQVGTESTNASADDIGPITGFTPTTGALGLLTVGKSNDINGTLTLTDWTLAAQTESTTGNDAGMALLYRLSMPAGPTGNLTVTDNGGTASDGVGLGQFASFVEVQPKIDHDGEWAGALMQRVAGMAMVAALASQAWAGVAARTANGHQDFTQAPEATPVGHGGAGARAVPVSYGFGPGARLVYAETPEVPGAPPVSGTVEAASEALADATGALSVSGTTTAASEGHADLVGALSLAGTSEAASEAHADAAGTLQLAGTVEAAAEAFADATGAIATPAAHGQTARAVPVDYGWRARPRAVTDDAVLGVQALEGTVTAASEAAADAAGTVSVDGTGTAASETFADAAGALDVSGTITAATEAFADASGASTAPALEDGAQSVPLRSALAWAVPAPAAFGSDDLAAAASIDGTITAASESFSDATGATAALGAHGTTARGLPVDYGWRRRPAPVAWPDEFPATIGAVTGTITAASESYAEATGTVVASGTATAASEAGSTASGTASLAGTATAAVEAYADALGENAAINGTVTAASETAGDATGALSVIGTGTAASETTGLASASLGITGTITAASEALAIAQHDQPEDTPGTGKYRPEWTGAAADLGAARGFSPEWAGAKSDLTDAGA